MAWNPLILGAVPQLAGPEAIVTQHLTVTAGGATVLDTDVALDATTVAVPDSAPQHLDVVSLTYTNLAGGSSNWSGPLDLVAVPPPPAPEPAPAPAPEPAPPVAPPAPSAVTTA